MRDERRRLTAVARGAAPADRYLRGGTLLNVYTGEVYPANVAILGERIAYVGARDDMVGPATEVLDVGGHVLVPGYVDPHVHPANLITPSALARHLLPLGTTTVVADTLGRTRSRASPTRAAGSGPGTSSGRSGIPPPSPSAR
jgi:adenine deaminase